MTGDDSLAKRATLVTLSYPPRFMRAQRAAQYLDISRSQFLQLVDDGILPRPIRMRGVVLWDREDLEVAVKDLESPRENEVQRLLKLKEKRSE